MDRVTEEEVRQVLDAYCLLEGRVEEIARLAARLRAHPNKANSFEIERVSFDIGAGEHQPSDSFTVRCSESWSYGGHDEYDRDFPLSFLWQTDAEITAIIEAETTEKAIREAAEREASRAHQDRMERETLAKLQAKWGTP